MPKFLSLLIILFAVSAVGIADVFLKKATLAGAGFMGTMKNPWLLAAIALYLFQIVCFTYVFVHGSKLTVIGILQTGLYALITMMAGMLYFHESLTLIQMIGIVLTLVGVMLLNM